MSTMPLRVTVVDDHVLFAESLVIALRARSVDARSVVPAAPASTCAQLSRTILEGRPRLVLLDLDLGLPGGTMRLLSALSAAEVSVVLLTGSVDPVDHGEALTNGARAVISKSMGLSEILSTVDRAGSGLPLMSPTERQRLLAVYQEATARDRELRERFDRMTRREAEVLGHLMAGQQVSEIARTRFVSEATVRTQVKSILAKLRVSSQLTAVGLAHELGWKPPTTRDDGAVPSGATSRRNTRSETGRGGIAVAR